jgi:hypothetical protein
MKIRLMVDRAKEATQSAAKVASQRLKETARVAWPQLFAGLLFALLRYFGFFDWTAAWLVTIVVSVLVIIRSSLLASQ